MRRFITIVFTLTFISIFLTSSMASAYISGGIYSSTPIDISWPQCGSSLGTNTRSFVIVGVNGGLANDTNSCLDTQLVWAHTSPGITNFPGLQLYVNTANPGGLGTPSWPSSNVDPEGNTAPNPHGVCDNSDSLACAWQYGWNRAVEDAQQRFKPAATSAGINNNPGDYRWWLDVETENTWKDGSTFADQSNVADLEGMTTYFKSLPTGNSSVSVGLYSTNYQWDQIVGSSVSSSSKLRGLKSWLAGANNIASAQQLCLQHPLTSGGTTFMAQILQFSTDYDIVCPILKFSYAKISNTHPYRDTYVTYSAKAVNYNGRAFPGVSVSFQVHYKSSIKTYSAGITNGNGVVSKKFKIAHVGSSYKIGITSRANKGGAIATAPTIYFIPKIRH